MVGLLRARPDVLRDVEIARSIGGGLDKLEGLSGESRGLLRAEWVVQRSTCQHHGGDISECVDEHIVWYPRRDLCIPDMERAAVEAMYDDLHKELAYHDGTFQRWATERSEAFPYHFRDGVTLSVSRQEDTSDDIFEKPERYAGEEF